MLRLMMVWGTKGWDRLGVTVVALVWSSVGCGSDGDDGGGAGGNQDWSIADCVDEPVCDRTEAMADYAWVDPIPTEYSDSQGCVLEAFRDRTVTYVSMDTSSIGTTDSPTYRTYYILGHDQVGMRKSGYANMQGPWSGDPVECTAKPSDYFQTCLDTFDLSCLDPDHWVTGCSSAPLTD